MVVQMSDKEVVQKQSGCMSGIWHLFDHRYLLGQRRHGDHRKSLPAGESTEKNIPSIALPTNPVSVASSSSSTAMPALDCSKSVVSEPCSSSVSLPVLRGRQPDVFMQSPDIRDVVKGSMTREPRVVSIKKVAKAEGMGPAMKHVDSPRPYPPVQSRFSCDGWESRAKSSVKIKEAPRLSLDSRQGYIGNSTNDPTSNKRPSSSVVARLMGLELEALSLTLTSVDESKALKTSSCADKELRQDYASVSSRVHIPLREVKVSHVMTRIPLETAPWKQEGVDRVDRVDRARQKSPFKSKERPPRAKPGSRSVYDEIEKRLTEHEYKTSGKDLRALKQILEAMQKTKTRLENKQHALDDGRIDDELSQKVDQPVSPAASQQKVKRAEVRRDSVGRKRLKDPNRKANSKAKSTSNVPECSRSVGSKMHRSKNGMNGSSSDLTMPKKQPRMQRPPSGSPSRNPKAKSIDLLQESGETKNPSQQSDTVSFPSENDSEATSTEWAQEVNSPFRPRDNHNSNITGWLTEEKSTVDHAKHTMEQPSPVSVLDAFYTEETPSPVKKKSNAFNDVDSLHLEEARDLNKLPTSVTIDQYSEFNRMKLENIKNLVHQIELLSVNTDDAAVNHKVKSSCESETGDHKYIEEIILASGCLKDLDLAATIVQLYPTVALINPGLFHVLEKTITSTELADDGYNKSFVRSKIRRKLVFDNVNDVLSHKLAMLTPFGPHKGRVLNGDKLLKELCSEIVDGLQIKSDIGMYDEEDEVTNIIDADVNKRSQDWDEHCHQVPGVVLDIERLIFKDLISEVVNFQVTSHQDWPVRPHCRRLFTM